MKQARASAPPGHQIERATSLAERATLLPISIEDNSEIIEALQDNSLARWLAALPVPVDQDASWKYLQFLHDPDICAQVLHVDGRFAGVISISSELTFWIQTEYHGKGLGSWAVQRFLNRLTHKSGQVSACCMHENTAAAAMLKKLDFVQVGPSFKRYSFAHGHAVRFLRFKRMLS